MTHEALVVVRCGADWLVVRRTDHGYWHVVSGGVESGETAREAAERELCEEIGLVAAVVDLEASFSYRPEAWEASTRGEGGAINVECFLAEAPDGWEPTLNCEHDEYRWCVTAEAERVLHWDEPRELVRRLA
ncbi:MAG: NUDIX domain-containing protein [Gaiellaceae bacterium MAG52_C11]|nr:NUDIX domain-containing protein [Candidatus Gaiellasilicea maunaloa]